jgi:hypothetical protein
MDLLNSKLDQLSKEVARQADLKAAKNELYQQAVMHDLLIRIGLDSSGPITTQNRR